MNTGPYTRSTQPDLHRAPDPASGVRTGAARHCRGLLPAAVITASFAVAYADVFVTLVRQWSTNDVYSYGFLIPPISVYLAWARRDRWKRLGWAPAPLAGWTVLLGGLGLLLAGRSVRIVGLQEVSIVISMAGLVILLMGAAALRVMWFPIAYLFLMMPIWDILTEQLHYPFQVVTADLGCLLLGVWGIPVHQEATILRLPTVTLEVARACSGVNYLIAVVAVGVPLAYMSFRDHLRRLLLVGFAILTATLANPVRVALIGILSYHGLSENVHGPWHLLQGLSVALVGYAALFGGMWFLSTVPGNQNEAPEQGTLAVERDPPFTLRAKSSRTVWPVIVAASLVLMAAGIWRPAPWPEPTPTDLSVEQVPLEIGEWKGRDNPLPFGPDGAPPAGPDELWRLYEAPSGEVVQLFVGRYARPDGQNGAVTFWGDSIHGVSSRTKVEIPACGVIEFNHAVLRRGSQETEILYWYNLDGRAAVSRVEAKLFYAWRKLGGAGGGPVVVVLVSSARGALDRNGVLTEMTGFLQQLLPFLDKCLGLSSDSSRCH